ncbi:hypothetical protein BC831DRAFT_515894 [Entophlyctis helioformis]|nr:hypothetical protein BC831DRAFT_515894 [Entophlyctis helioformis]
MTATVLVQDSQSESDLDATLPSSVLRLPSTTVSAASATPASVSTPAHASRGRSKSVAAVQACQAVEGGHAASIRFSDNTADRDSSRKRSRSNATGGVDAASAIAAVAAAASYNASRPPKVATASAARDRASLRRFPGHNGPPAQPVASASTTKSRSPAASSDATDHRSLKRSRLSVPRSMSNPHAPVTTKYASLVNTRSHHPSHARAIKDEYSDDLLMHGTASTVIESSQGRYKQFAFSHHEAFSTSRADADDLVHNGPDSPVFSQSEHMDDNDVDDFDDCPTDDARHGALLSAKRNRRGSLAQAL